MFTEKKESDFPIRTNVIIAAKALGKDQLLNFFFYSSDHRHTVLSSSSQAVNEKKPSCYMRMSFDVIDS